MPSKNTKQSSAEWLSQLRDDLTEMRTLAADHQKDCQHTVKKWYDDTVKERHFDPGDKVMVFTPAITGSRGEKLSDRWSGPYTVIGRLSPVTYTIEMPDKRRKDHAIHVTALKQWHPPMVNLATFSTDPDYTADIPDYSPSTGPIFPELGEHLDESQRADLRRIWDDYPLVITHSLGKARSTVHKIDTGDTAPIRLHPYHIPKVWQEPVKAELTKLLDTGIIEHSSAPWAAPMFAIPKKTPGQIRLVNDYHRLNAVTVPDPYYQPRVEDVLYGMAEAKIFTILDLAQGFYQIPIPPADRDKTTVVTPFGKFRFTVMPFGLRNAPATFQLQWTISSTNTRISSSSTLMIWQFSVLLGLNTFAISD